LKSYAFVKWLSIIGCLLGLLLTPGIGLLCQEQNINSDNVIKSAERYFSSPSTENGLKFYLSLAESPIMSKEINLRFKEARNYILDHIDVLEGQVLKGETNAVKVAFRLYNFDDADLSYRLNMMLGNLVNINPKLFLGELKNHMSILKRLDMSPPVAQSERREDPQYLPDYEPLQSELRSRAKALASVKDENLSEVKNECLSVLVRELSRLSPYFIKERDVPTEYHEIYDFLETIKYPKDPTSAEGFRLEKTPNWDTAKVMKFISKEGIEFTDVNDNSKNDLPYERIEQELRLRKGEAFKRLGHLAYIYSIPYKQYSELKFEAFNTNVRVFVSSWYELVFQKEDNQFKLISCKYTEVEGD
jgi:hypothetical protein